jgi:hypothetical protein
MRRSRAVEGERGVCDGLCQLVPRRLDGYLRSIARGRTKRTCDANEVAMMSCKSMSSEGMCHHR